MCWCAQVKLGFLSTGIRGIWDNLRKLSFLLPSIIGVLAWKNRSAFLYTIIRSNSTFLPVAAQLLKILKFGTLLISHKKRVLLPSKALPWIASEWRLRQTWRQGNLHVFNGFFWCNVNVGTIMLGVCGLTNPGLVLPSEGYASFWLNLFFTHWGSNFGTRTYRT